MLENWSLRRGGRLREVVATGGSTVRILLLTMREGKFRPHEPHIFEPFSIGPVLNYWKFKQNCTVWQTITKVNTT